MAQNFENYILKSRHLVKKIYLVIFSNYIFIHFFKGSKSNVETNKKSEVGFQQYSALVNPRTNSVAKMKPSAGPAGPRGRMLPAVPSPHTFPLSEKLSNRSKTQHRCLLRWKKSRNFVLSNIETLKKQERHLIDYNAQDTVSGASLHTKAMRTMAARPLACGATSHAGFA